eukprot:517488_1
MNDYDEFTTDTVNINEVLDDFLYVMKNYNDDDQYEYIHTQLGGFCQLDQCKYFRRRYSDKQTQSMDYTVTHQIIDKIHCFYRHSFDTGYRLNCRERLIIANIQDDDEIKVNHIDEFNHSLVNKTFLTASEILSSKIHQYNNMHGLNERIGLKYYGLCSDNTQEASNMYRFGQHFEYGDANITFTRMKRVSQKYSTLKNELLNNLISTLTAEQFNQEYEKAQIHIDSYYRKMYHAEICINSLFSLMVYCNYSELSKKFSETYYIKQQIRKHNEFYNLGKSLKIAIQTY